MESCQVLTQIRFISSHVECLKNTFIRNSFGLYAERHSPARLLRFPLGRARAPLFLSLMGKTLRPLISNAVRAGRETEHITERELPTERCPRQPLLPALPVAPRTSSVRMSPGLGETPVSESCTWSLQFSRFRVRPEGFGQVPK